MNPNNPPPPPPRLAFGYQAAALPVTPPATPISPHADIFHGVPTHLHVALEEIINGKLAATGLRGLSGLHLTIGYLKTIYIDIFPRRDIAIIYKSIHDSARLYGIVPPYEADCGCTFCGTEKVFRGEDADSDEEDEDVDDEGDEEDEMDDEDGDNEGDEGDDEEAVWKRCFERTRAWAEEVRAGSEMAI